MPDNKFAFFYSSIPHKLDKIDEKLFRTRPSIVWYHKNMKIRDYLFALPLSMTLQQGLRSNLLIQI